MAIGLRPVTHTRQLKGLTRVVLRGHLKIYVGVVVIGIGGYRDSSRREVAE